MEVCVLKSKLFFSISGSTKSYKMSNLYHILSFFMLVGLSRGNREHKVGSFFKCKKTILITLFKMKIEGPQHRLVPGQALVVLDAEHQPGHQQSGLQAGHD